MYKIKSSGREIKSSGREIKILEQQRPGLKNLTFPNKQSTLKIAKVANYEVKLHPKQGDLTRHTDGSSSNSVE